MDVNDNAGIQNERVVLEFIASKLAPTEDVIVRERSRFSNVVPFQ
jgi:hypothetical protein